MSEHHELETHHKHKRKINAHSRLKGLHAQENHAGTAVAHDKKAALPPSVPPSTQIAHNPAKGAPVMPLMIGTGF